MCYAVMKTVTSRSGRVEEVRSGEEDGAGGDEREETKDPQTESIDDESRELPVVTHVFKVVSLPLLVRHKPQLT